MSGKKKPVIVCTLALKLNVLIYDFRTRLLLVLPSKWNFKGCGVAFVSVNSWDEDPDCLFMVQEVGPYFPLPACHVAGCSAGSCVPRHSPCVDLIHRLLVTEAQPVSSGTEPLLRNGPPVRFISSSWRRKQCGLSKRCVLFISQRWVTSTKIIFPGC